MAEEDYEEKLKAKKKPVLLIVVALAVAAGGAGAYFFMPQKGSQSKAAKTPVVTPKVKKVGPMVAMDPIIANLNEPDASRYLKASIHLELSDDSVKSDVEAAMVPIKNHMLLYISTLSVDDTQGGEKKLALQKELKKVANKFLGEHVVSAVYFSELVVQ